MSTRFPLSTTEREKLADARLIFHRAIRLRELAPGPCAHLADGQCSGQIEGHHEDYDFPLAVIWLCKKHHSRLTAKQRKQANTVRDENPLPKPDAAWMGLKETAAHYGVCTRTVKRWINQGIVKAIQPAGRGGSILIPKP